MDVGCLLRPWLWLGVFSVGQEGDWCSLGPWFAVPQPEFGIFSVGISAVLTFSLFVPRTRNKRSSRGQYLPAPAFPHPFSEPAQHLLPSPSGQHATALLFPPLFPRQGQRTEILMCPLVFASEGLEARLCSAPLQAPTGALALAGRRLSPAPRKTALPWRQGHIAHLRSWPAAPACSFPAENNKPAARCAAYRAASTR